MKKLIVEYGKGIRMNINEKLHRTSIEFGNRRQLAQAMLVKEYQFEYPKISSEIHEIMLPEMHKFISLKQEPEQKESSRDWFNRIMQG